MTNQLGAIDTIVWLMLENRSFDQLLGFLYTDEGNVSPSGQAFDGLTGSETNPDDTGTPVRIYRLQASDPHPYLFPGADPGEGFQNTNVQLFSVDPPPAGATPTNQGFVVNFKAAIASDLAKKYKDTLPDVQPAHIMGAYTPALLPVLSGLAKGYAVCDAWHASAPTETMPNRAFALAGTSQGHMDDSVKAFTCPSIFGRLTDKGLDWSVFGYTSPPLTRLDFTDTHTAPNSHFGLFKDFQARAAAGTLAPFTFLEPSWGATGNSEHPNYDIAKGEQFLHDVYYALRNGPKWASTLLIVCYDEHGGNYDHVAPPTGATPPGDGSVGQFGFDFTRFGVRVPAILVSPRIAPGTVFRPAEGVIDHTSVLKTLQDRWGVAPLTARDQAAASLGDVLTLATPRAAEDDPLKGVIPPVSKAKPHGGGSPTAMQLRHAALLADLPIPDAHGFYQSAAAAAPAAGASADAIEAYIAERSAAWSRRVAGG